MTRATSNLLKKALALPVEECAELAGSLIESLDASEDPSVEAAWDEEVVRRMADLDSGMEKSVSLERVRARLASSIR
jgi:putative addiction module component (TIGR02574 family)